MVDETIAMLNYLFSQAIVSRRGMQTAKHVVHCERNNHRADRHQYHPCSTNRNTKNRRYHQEVPTKEEAHKTCCSFAFAPRDE